MIFDMFIHIELNLREVVTKFSRYFFKGFRKTWIFEKNIRSNLSRYIVYF